jgi:hypothetical protein
VSREGNEGARWVFDPGDAFAHVVGGTGAGLGVLVTRCGR